MTNFLFQSLGWIGVTLCLLAYFLVSTGKITGQSTAYQGMNFFGAVCLTASFVHQQAWQGVVINVVWACIAVWAVMKMKK